MKKVRLAVLTRASWVVTLCGLVSSCAPGFSPSMPPADYKGPIAEQPIQESEHYWVYENADGRRGRLDPGKLLGELRFPLWVGKSWGYHGKAIDAGINPTKPRPIGTTDVTCEVLNFKQITVIAGTFGAFQCQCRCELSIEKIGYDSFCGEWTLWYAPKVKNIISRDTEESYFQLVEYENE